MPKLCCYSVTTVNIRYSVLSIINTTNKLSKRSFYREAIKEDDDGFLEASVADIVQRAKRRRQAMKQVNQKLGMMRHLFLLLDCSESMSSQDLKPTRLLCTIKVGSMSLVV